MANEVILEIVDLTAKLGGKRVLDGLCMEIRSGHVHAIIGPNGAGKSTLASCIMGLEGFPTFAARSVLPASRWPV